MKEQIEWLNSVEARRILRVSSCELAHLRQEGILQFQKKGNAFMYSRLSCEQQVREPKRPSICTHGSRYLAIPPEPSEVPLEDNIVRRRSLLPRNRLLFSNPERLGLPLSLSTACGDRLAVSVDPNLLPWLVHRLSPRIRFQ